MLDTKKEDTTTIQIPMESSKPVKTPKTHDPKWVHTYVVYSPMYSMGMA